jgi:NDP-sugar pyrophosphorylase family protein
MHENPRYISEKFDGNIIDYMTEQRITAVPVVNDNKEILDVILNRSYNPLKGKERKCQSLVNNVIVMAGGKGTRLYPYTKILPKPLIPIGDVPILERILNRFYDYGVSKFYITVNYKKEMIKAYFSDIKPPYEICYIEEDKPLGTAGSIRLIEKTFDEPVIVTNCDILIETDYSEIVEHHNESKNDITIVSSLKNIIIPYGVVFPKEDGIITSMEEKPEISNFINTGMYIVNPEFLNWIPKDQVFHMTDLVQKMMNAGKRIGMYPISENSFLDMGEFAEMKRMEERINNNNKDIG